QSNTDDEHAGGRAGAADVQDAEGARAVDLIAARLTGRLQLRVENLAHAGGADRVAAADEPARRIDRQLAAGRDHALFDRLPRLARRGQPEVIDRHVLGGREAVVGLDTVERPAVGDLRASIGVDDRLPRV